MEHLLFTKKKKFDVETSWLWLLLLGFSGIMLNLIPVSSQFIECEFIYLHLAKRTLKPSVQSTGKYCNPEVKSVETGPSQVSSFIKF